MYSLDKDALKAEIQQTVRNVLESALNPVEIVEESGFRSEFPFEILISDPSFVDNDNYWNAWNNLKALIKRIGKRNEDFSLEPHAVHISTGLARNSQLKEMMKKYKRYFVISKNENPISLERFLKESEIVEEESSAETTSTDDVGAKDMTVGKKKEDDESEDDEKESDDDEVKEACKTKSK